jgi:hypothetical protein
MNSRAKAEVRICDLGAKKIGSIRIGRKMILRFFMNVCMVDPKNAYACSSAFLCAVVLYYIA